MRGAKGRGRSISGSGLDKAASACKVGMSSSRSNHSSPHLKHVEGSWGVLVGPIVASLREGASKQSTTGGREGAEGWWQGAGQGMEGFMRRG